MLGLRPWEFEQYTMREFFQHVEGYSHSQRNEWRRLAMLACWLLAPYRDKDRPALTPGELLGEVVPYR